MNEITNVTIISTNINKHILNKYKNYQIIDNNFSYEELLIKKKVIFYNILNNLKEEKLKELFNYLNNNNILYINITNNLELSLYTNYLIVYDNNNIVIEGKTNKVLENEKILKRLGFKLPFIIELSILLKDYNLIDKIYLNKESLVEDIWK